MYIVNKLRERARFVARIYIITQKCIVLSRILFMCIVCVCVYVKYIKQLCNMYICKWTCFYLCFSVWQTEWRSRLWWWWCDDKGAMHDTRFATNTSHMWFDCFVGFTFRQSVPWLWKRALFQLLIYLIFLHVRLLCSDDISSKFWWN